MESLKNSVPPKMNVAISIVSISAIATTVGLMFCGVPICRQIKKQGSVGDISGFPFIMGVLVGSFWFRYGLLKNDRALIVINAAAFAFMFSYAMFFLHYSKSKRYYLSQLLVVFLMVSVMVAWVEIAPNIYMLGIISTAINIVNFGAPLAGLSVVLTTREVSTLPLPLCFVQFLVTAQWCIYGCLVRDVFVVIPSATGMALSLIQLSLFIIFPNHSKEQSPLEKLAAWFTRRDLIRAENIKYMQSELF